MNTFLKCYNKHSYERYTILLCCKIEHEVTDEGTCGVQLSDGGILRVYTCNKCNRNFKSKEYNEDRNYN